MESFTVVLYSEHFLSIENRLLVAKRDRGGGRAVEGRDGLGVWGWLM